MNTSGSPYIYLIGLWPLAAFGIWALWNSVRAGRDAKLVQQSLTWPETQGKVTSSRVVWGHVEVNYEYLAAGYPHTVKYKISLTPVVSNRYARGAARLSTEAKQDMSDFPPGANIIVRYDPLRPERSVLFCRGDIAERQSGGQAKIAPKFETLE